MKKSDSIWIVVLLILLVVVGLLSLTFYFNFVVGSIATGDVVFVESEIVEEGLSGGGLEDEGDVGDESEDERVGSDEDYLG